jgi:hypothetical protein
MKEQLKILLERDYNIPTLRPTLLKLLEFNEEQLTGLLINSVKISNELTLQYIPGSGFRCWNINTSSVGVLPVAGLIERKLNKELLNNNLFS